MIAFDTAPYQGQTMLISITCNPVYIMGPFHNGDVFSNIGFYFPPALKRQRPKIPAITDSNVWFEAQRQSYDRAPPSRQRRRYLDEIMRTKTLNRRFT